MICLFVVFLIILQNIYLLSYEHILDNILVMWYNSIVIRY